MDQQRAISPLLVSLLVDMTNVATLQGERLPVKLDPAPCARHPHLDS